MGSAGPPSSEYPESLCSYMRGGLPFLNDPWHRLKRIEEMCPAAAKSIIPYDFGHADMPHLLHLFLVPLGLLAEPNCVPQYFLQLAIAHLEVFQSSRDWAS